MIRFYYHPSPSTAKVVLFLDEAKRRLDGRHAFKAEWTTRRGAVGFSASGPLRLEPDAGGAVLACVAAISNAR